MRWIYLSPHLDDAILSCGGIIFEQIKAGIPVEIWNWMSGIPASDAPLSDLARSKHAEWGTASAKETMDLRLAEDRQAVLRVDALSRYFNFLDCIYRYDEKGAALYNEDVFVPPHAADAHLVDGIATLIRENLREDDTLLCPLTIGNHPDHVLLRRAAERVGHPLLYYADIPYILWYPEEYLEITGKLSIETYPVSEAGLSVWQDAVAAYSSQMGMLFEGEEMMRNALELYWRTTRATQLFRG